jgi:hypothetical protein
VAIRMLEQKLLPMDEIVTHRLPLKDFQKGIDLRAFRRDVGESHPRTLIPLVISLLPLAVVESRALRWPDYVMLAVYFALNLGIGAWCARKRRSSKDGFFLGNGQVVWWVAAVSTFATGISSISFMALPAKAFQTDWMAFGTAPAQNLAGVFAGHRVRRAAAAAFDDHGL